MLHNTCLSFRYPCCQSHTWKYADCDDEQITKFTVSCRRCRQVWTLSVNLVEQMIYSKEEDTQVPTGRIFAKFRFDRNLSWPGPRLPKRMFLPYDPEL